MTPLNFPPLMISSFSGMDFAAVAFLAVCVMLIGWVVENPPASRPSVTVLMTHYRRDWMAQFVTRQPRIFDATVLDSLRQGTAFFASACMITLGGGLAVIGNGERLDMIRMIPLPIPVRRMPPRSTSRRRAATIKGCGRSISLWARLDGYWGRGV